MDNTVSPKEVRAGLNAAIRASREALAAIDRGDLDAAYAAAERAQHAAFDAKIITRVGGKYKPDPA